MKLAWYPRGRTVYIALYIPQHSPRSQQSLREAIPTSLAMQSMDRSTSQAALLSSDASHSSFRSPSLPVYSSSSGIGVIFQVVRLVHVFCKRVGIRRHPKPPTSTQHDSFCNDFERQASIRIDKYLGRRPADKEDQVRLGKPKSSGALDLRQAAWQQHFESLLLEVNESTGKGGDDLRLLASKDFLRRRTHFRLRHLSLRDIARLLDLISRLLGLLNSCRHLDSEHSPVCAGDEVPEIYLANLEHLLLCLREQLCCQLVADCLDLVWKLVSPKNHIKCLHEWFFEFPDSKHPLSTTWPWSIRPSLAVLWGVCWMFYDSEDQKPTFFDAAGNMVNAEGTILVPSQVMDFSRRYQRQQQQQYQANDLAGFAATPANQMRRPVMQGSSRSQGGQPSISTPGMAASGSSPAQPHFTSSPSHSSPGRESLRFARSTSNSNVSLAPGSSGHHQAGGSSHDEISSLAIPGTNITYSSATAAAPASAHAYTASAQFPPWLPQDYSPGSAGLAFDNGSAYLAGDSSWLATEQPGLLYEQQSQQPLPPRPRNPSTPAIRVFTDVGTQDFSQPQDAIVSASSAPSSLPPQDYHPYNNYNPGRLSPQTPHFMPPDQENMQHTPPVSPQNSPHDTSMGEQVSRKRSHSVMSQHDVAAIANAAHSRSGSIISGTGASPNEVSDEFFPKRQNTRAFKRGDPPMNEEHKYICDFSEECRGQTFDRKCEWSKHMDKHDRPYRCQHQSCAKLQGFTYSGGLLRHEREVHGKHGGPKAQLMCPHSDCKRHAGKGFTRKENLNEHLRRVHPSAQLESQASTLRRDGTDVGLEDGETPASRISEPVDQEDLLTSPMLGKRKRGDGLFASLEPETQDDMENMRQELKRLRTEVEQRDERIRQMQAAAAENEDKTRRLEAQLNMQQQLQQHPVEG